MERLTRKQVQKQNGRYYSAGDTTINSAATYREALIRLAAYEDIGTPEQFAAWKKAIDYARAQAINLQERIKLKENTNYREEVMRILILEESQRAYIAVLNEAQAALEAQEGE